MAYHLEGSLLEVCDCRVLCPCWIGEDPDNPPDTYDALFKSGTRYHVEETRSPLRGDRVAEVVVEALRPEPDVSVVGAAHVALAAVTSPRAMLELEGYGDIDFVHVRHEEYGVFAAVAEAAMTGRPVAVCGTAGPGVAHLINGLLDARKAAAPIIASLPVTTGRRIERVVT